MTRRNPDPHVYMRTPARKRRYEELDGLGPDGLPYRPRPARRRLIALALSAILASILCACYFTRPDAAAAVTVFPIWAWLVPGLLLLFLGLSRASLRPAALVLALWIAFVALHAEEPRSLLRTDPWPADGWLLALQSGRGVRVVSLNCAGGQADAASEVASHQPSIVLLQEAPSREEVDALAQRLFRDASGVAWGGDTAIIARGTVETEPLPESVRPYATRARVRLPSGTEVAVVSLRLEPPLVRANLLAPTTWRAQTENRLIRRAQVRALVTALADVPADTPLIVGGDTNAPGGDGAIDPLRARAHDGFGEGGRGWGNTAMNDAPMLRLDQVWASDHFHAGAVFARRTRHSDHRLVVSDLWLSRLPARH